MSRTTPCDPGIRAGRLAKASRFLAAGETVAVLADHAAEAADPAVTLYVHAGIAAADALCCAHLGEHARGEDHRAAVRLLRRIERGLADDLSTLLSVKSTSAYSPATSGADTVKRAARAASRLVAAAARVASE